MGGLVFFSYNTPRTYTTHVLIPPLTPDDAKSPLSSLKWDGNTRKKEEEEETKQNMTGSVQKRGHYKSPLRAQLDYATRQYHAHDNLTTF